MIFDCLCSANKDGEALALTAAWIANILQNYGLTKENKVMKAIRSNSSVLYSCAVKITD